MKQSLSLFLYLKMPERFFYSVSLLYLVPKNYINRFKAFIFFPQYLLCVTDERTELKYLEDINPSVAFSSVV